MKENDECTMCKGTGLKSPTEGCTDCLKAWWINYLEFPECEREWKALNEFMYGTPEEGK